MPWVDYEGRRAGEPRRWVEPPPADLTDPCAQLTAQGGDRYIERKKVVPSPDQEEEIARERAEGYW